MYQVKEDAKAHQAVQRTARLPSDAHAGRRRRRRSPRCCRLPRCAAAAFRLDRRVQLV